MSEASSATTRSIHTERDLSHNEVSSHDFDFIDAFFVPKWKEL